MALQGTLKDFALPDILQLIGIQRKTGILTMQNGRDTVTLQFFQGQVVGADTRDQKLEDRLGSVLVRTGKLTEAQLREVLAQQRKTLQRLGYILVKSGHLSLPELREAIRIQINQIVYRLFRWRDGHYDFTPMDHLEYDRELTIPVPAETVLMEGARMIDEWPIIERRIRSPRMVFQKTPAGRAHEEALPALVGDVGFNLDLEERKARQRAGPTTEESEILRLVSGEATVQDIVDRCPQEEFDVHRILYDFLDRRLIEEVPRSGSARAAKSPRSAKVWVARAGQAAMAAVALWSLIHPGSNTLAPWKARAAQRETDLLRTYVSHGRLERIESAIEMFYLDAGAIPERLDALVRGGYLRERDLLDPWGHPYEYRLLSEGYVLTSRDAKDRPEQGLALTHRFSPAQRMMLEGPASTGSGEPPSGP